MAVIAAVFAFYASSRGFQQGDAVPVITYTSLAANLVGISGGFIVFGDPLPGDLWSLLAHIMAFGLVLAAAFLVPGSFKMGEAQAAPSPTL